MLKTINIKRFKNIEESDLELDRINILIGSNNSGKSSILQAIQFAVSVAQTSSLEKGLVWRKNERMPTSISPNQLIYSPFRDVSALAPNRDLREEPQYAILIGFVDNNLESVEISVRKGRNKNITIELKGKTLGEELRKIEEPFSIFVPGLAGIPSAEEYKTPSIVRKAAAKGDANNVFRNVLNLLYKDPENWHRFIEDFQLIFPNMDIYIDFNPDRDEFIEATIQIDGKKLPIDAAGTGVLQAVQILSYVNAYKPKLLLLDEPDSHLHPNNQRKLANMLIKLAEERDFQIILSTHSRHMIDEFNGDAKLHWVRNGGVVDESTFDEASVLLDLGALDKGELLLHGTIKCVLLTEDDDITPMKAILEASGFNMKEVDPWSYKGCTKIDVALVLNAFIKKHASAATVLLHRDRDYQTDSEAEAFRTSIEKAGMRCFLTTGTDIESHYLLKRHIHDLYPSITLERAQAILDNCIEEAQLKSIEKFINSRTQVETAECRKRMAQVNHGEISREVNKLYEDNPIKYCHGKSVISRLRGKIRDEIKTNIDLYRATEFIKDETLAEIGLIIWPKQKKKESV
jgi:AAA15 family ATPase/GTPase